MTSSQIGVLDLLRAPGVARHLRGEIVVDDLGTSSARLRQGSPIEFACSLEARGMQVIATGEAKAEWEGACRRCLESTNGVVTVSFTEVFESEAVDGETWPIVDNTVDLAPVLTEAIVLELPLAPLCRADCAGPAPDRYPTGTVDAPDEHHDPRWAALEGLRIVDE